MTTTNPTPVTVTAEQIAAYLGWLLGNRNAELDLADEAGTVLDAAFNANADGVTVELIVSTYNGIEGGSQRFTLTVAEVADPAEVSTGSRWWVSWYFAGPFEYHGPWWISGSRAGQDTICAAIVAESEDAARQVVAEAHDESEPVIEWRFVKPRDGGWSPFSDRFERAEWMRWPD